LASWKIADRRVGAGSGYRLLSRAKRVS
jgi:hypothetical protein